MQNRDYLYSGWSALAVGVQLAAAPFCNAKASCKGPHRRIACCNNKVRRLAGNRFAKKGESFSNRRKNITVSE